MAMEAMRVGERSLGAQDIDEDAIPAFVMEAIDRRLEDAVVIQLGSFAPAPIIAKERRRPLRTTRNWPQ
jgi:hypothetical protein